MRRVPHALLLLLGLSGCLSADLSNRPCEVQSDCLDGFECLAAVCQLGPRRQPDAGVRPPDAGPLADAGPPADAGLEPVNDAGLDAGVDAGVFVEPWLDLNFALRARVNINRPADLTDSVPMHIRLDPALLPGIEDNGLSDVVIFDDDGAQVAAELDGPTRPLAWIEAQPDTTDRLWIYWSGPDVDQTLAPEIWSPNYVAVWHLSNRRESISGQSLELGTTTLNVGKLGGAQQMRSELNQGGLGTDAFVPNLATDDDVTVEAWIQTDAIEPGTYDNVIYSAGQPGGAWLIYMTITPDGRLSCFHLGVNGDVFNASNPVGNTLLDGTFHHVACTRDAAARRVDLYLDGSPIGSTNYADAPPSAVSANAAIGMDHGGGAVFHGTIDELRVSDRVLSLETIRSNFLASGPVITIERFENRP